MPNLMQQLIELRKLATPDEWHYEAMDRHSPVECYARLATADGRTIADTANSSLIDIHFQDESNWDETGRRNLQYIAQAHNLLPEIATQYAALVQWVGTVLQDRSRFTASELDQADRMTERINNAG